MLRVTGFYSLLDVDPEDSADIGAPEQPSCFGDLHLDQVVASVCAGREEYELESFFYRPLWEIEAVHYRHHVLHDLEGAQLLDAVRAFASRMQEMRKHLALAEKLCHRLQQQRWFLEAVAVYCSAVRRFSGQLLDAEISSAGFVALREYLASYSGSEAFTSLAAETERLLQDLAAVRYAVHLKGSRVKVSKYDGEPDLSAAVEQTFSKFKQGSAKDYRVGIRQHPEINHVDGQILD